MDPFILLRTLDLLPLVLVIAVGLAAASLLVWLVAASVMWVVSHRNHEDAPQPMAEADWFESLPAARVE